MSDGSLPSRQLQSLRTPLAITIANAIHRALPVRPWRTRFAPAPTGYLHLGHVVNAIFVWGIARARGGTVVLRIEDHDRTRVRPAYEAALLDDLDWLGFVPDIGTAGEFRAGHTPYRQSDNTNRYASVLSEWETRGYTYACTCTRRDMARVADQYNDGLHDTRVRDTRVRDTRVRDIRVRDTRIRDTRITEASSEVRYPGTCANASVDGLLTPARRLRGTREIETFTDIQLGPQRQVPEEQCGDTLLRDRNGNFTYQFAVVVDDYDQDIGVVIRGEDLLASTGRQFQLSRRLGRHVPPLFLHHPLVLRRDGLKLSKSLGDSGVRELRDAGVPASEVLGRAAYLAGLITQAVPLMQCDLATLFAYNAT